MEFYEKFKETYPENINEDGFVLLLGNEGNGIYSEYNKNLRENILFTATYGNHLLKINYPGIKTEEIIKDGRTDITINNLEDKVFGIIENGITTSTDPKKAIYKKIVQAINYLLSYSLENKLDTTNDIHITINMYNPNNFLSKRKNFSAYMDSKSSSYRTLFNTYGMFSVTYMFSQKELNELFSEMNFEKKQIDFIENKEDIFQLDDQLNAMQYTFFQGGVAIPNDFPEVKSDSFSYIYENKTENRFVINGLPYTSFKRGEHFNSRPIHKNKFEEKILTILKSSLFRFTESHRQIDNPELYKIGWQPREIVADYAGTTIFFSKDNSKVLMASESSELGNGQTTSTAILEIKKIANLDFEFFKAELDYLIPTKDLLFDSHYKEFQIFLQKMMPKVNVTVHKMPWNARLNMEINNNVEEQSSADKESYKHKDIMKKVISKIYETNNPLLSNLHLTISKSFSQDPRYNQSEFKNKDFSDLNILAASYFEGQRINNFFNKELRDMRDRLKERKNELEYKEFNETHIVLFRHMLKNSANSKVYRKKGFDSIRSNFIKEEVNLKKVLTELNEKINILKGNSFESYKTSEFKRFEKMFLETVEKYYKKYPENERIFNFIIVVKSFFRMEPRLEAYEQIKEDLIELIEIKVEIDSILNLLEIDLYIDNLNPKTYQKFTNKDSFKTFIGILMGLNNYSIDFNLGVSIINDAIEAFKDVKELNFTSVRYKNVSDYTQKEIILLEKLFTNLLKYKQNVIDGIKETSQNKDVIKYAKEIVFLKINTENLGGGRISKILKEKYDVSIPSTTIQDNLNRYQSHFSFKK